MNFLRKVNSALDSFLRKACIALLVVFTLVVLLQIATRNYIKIPLDWTAEVSLLCFLWSVYLGSAVAIKSRSHYIIELVPAKYVLVNHLMNIFADIVIFVLIYVLIAGGIKFTEMGFARYCTSLPISMAWLFIVMPISGVAMFLFGIENLVDDFSKLKSLMGRSAAQ